jgi:tRNA (guanosine-2'-O-)-methyltransferase
MDSYSESLIEHLSGFVTSKRLELFDRILDQRTRYLSVVLEDIYQSQNASAVLRTCDCVGIQDVHIVEESNAYEINPDVSLGSNQWLSMHYYKEGREIPREQHNRKPGTAGGGDIGKAAERLKREGYRLVATSPHREGSTPDNFDLAAGKAAFMFGTELNGLTERALELADEFIQIPMVGFTESYNISVSAAVVLYTLRKRLEASGLDWQLPSEERSAVKLNWLRNSVKMSRQIERKFRQEWEDA